MKPATDAEIAELKETVSLPGLNMWVSPEMALRLIARIEADRAVIEAAKRYLFGLYCDERNASGGEQTQMDLDALRDALAQREVDA